MPVFPRSLRRSFTSMSAPKLIAIIGATGTGKSELAVSLARRFNGEILNADAMQLYHGLPIITNKIPEAEQHAIPHHLLSCIPLSAIPWTVAEFVRAAQSTIAAIRSRGKLPILVGGTHYYTQSLLFHDTLATAGPAEASGGDDDIADHPLLAQPNPVLLEELARVDPVMAARWHPNDRRKIQRSLAIWLATGRPASEIYAAQETPRLRDETLVLWPHANPAALAERLDGRVERMLYAGLEAEVREVAAAVAADPGIDQSAGICVSIGYKEFLPYIRGEASREEAVEQTKVATRRYAKRQVRWIRLTLGPMLKGQAGLYVLDSSDVARFEDDVVVPAAEVVSRWLEGDEVPDPQDVGGELAKQMLATMGEEKGSWETKTCEVCGVVGTTASDWKNHVASKKHKVLVSKAKQKHNTSQ